MAENLGHWRIAFAPAGQLFLHQHSRHGRRHRSLGEIMEWTAPAFEEICLNCEINSYASAKL
ncbi:MAG: pyrroloquinoline quinone precursor peptide PqqA [Candidatus Sulfotelmatobacter sp.]